MPCIWSQFNLRAFTSDQTPMMTRETQSLAATVKGIIFKSKMPGGATPDDHKLHCCFVSLGFSMPSGKHVSFCTGTLIDPSVVLASVLASIDDVVCCAVATTAPLIFSLLMLNSFILKQFQTAAHCQEQLCFLKIHFVNAASHTSATSL